MRQINCRIIYGQRFRILYDKQVIVRMCGKIKTPLVAELFNIVQVAD